MAKFNDVVTYSNENEKLIHSAVEIADDSGQDSIQQVTVYKVNLKKANYELAVWQKTANNIAVRKTVIDHAKDFELNNPNYEVMAAINCDYFSFATEETINAIKDFEGKIVKFNNNPKYDVICFNSKEPVYKRLRRPEYKDTYTLVIYDEDTREILKVIDDVKFKKDIFIDNTHGVKGDYLEFDISYCKIEGNLVSILAVNPAINPIKANPERLQMVIDDDVKRLYQDKKLRITIYNTPANFEIENQFFGFDNEIVKDGYVKEYEELKGQSEENNRTRHPRSGFGYDKNGNIFFIVVDGRQPQYSDGVGLKDFARIMDHFKINMGFNIDGGGSSQLAMKNRETNELQVYNRPCQGTSNFNYRRVADVLLVIKKRS